MFLVTSTKKETGMTGHGRNKENGNSHFCKIGAEPYAQALS